MKPLYFIYIWSQTFDFWHTNFPLLWTSGCLWEILLIHFLMSAPVSGATINPGIIEMQMSSVTAPRLSGGQVAHFIMLLSCCPLLVWEQGPLEGCCVAMYNSCSNSYMSGWGRARDTDTHTHRGRQRERGSCWSWTLLCLRSTLCAWAGVCVWLLAHTHRGELCLKARATGTHTHTHTHTHKHTSVRIGIQNQIKNVPSRHLCQFL